jgi:hypothetical protein
MRRSVQTNIGQCLRVEERPMAWAILVKAGGIVAESNSLAGYGLAGHSNNGNTVLRPQCTAV